MVAIRFILFFFSFFLNFLIVFPEKLEKIETEDVYLPPLKSSLVLHEQNRRSQKSLKQIKNIVNDIIQAQEKNLTVREPKEKTASRMDKEGILLLDESYKDSELTQKKISLKIKKMSVKKIIQAIGNLSKIRFVVDSNINYYVEDISFDNIPLSVALQIIFNGIYPTLGLVKTLGVWRVMRQDQAIEFLKAQKQKKMELDYASSSYTILNAKWDGDFKSRVKQLWDGIVGEVKKTPLAYIALDDKSKKIFFKGRKSQIEDFLKILTEIDVENRQVRLDVRVIIADKSFDESLGFQWSGRYDRSTKIRRLGFAGFGAKKDATGQSAVSTPFGDVADWSLNLIPGWNAVDSVTGLAKKSGMISVPFVFRNQDYTKLLNLTLNAAENRHEIKTILKPSLLVNSEEVAEILVGDSMPLQTQVAESVGSNISNVTTTQYKDVGIKLRVKPEVSAGGNSVFLDIFLENSSLSPLNKSDYEWQQGGQNYSIGYTIKTSRSKNRVLLKSGQTTLISGLIFNSNDIAKTGVPGLKDLPILGWMFRGSKKNVKDYQLLVFITPVVI